MNKETQSILVGLMGGLLVGITVSGRFTSYVKPGFGPFLLVAGGLLIVVGVLSLIATIGGEVRAERRAAEGDQDHRHDHPGDAHGHDSSKAPWLMLAPVVVLLVMAPPALGAESVARNAGSQAVAGMEPVGPAEPIAVDPSDKSGAGGGGEGYAPNDGSGRGVGTANFDANRPTMQFDPLPAGDRPVIGLKDFVLRALYDAQETVSKQEVTVTGFIAPAGSGFTGGYSIARLVISCCAADANPLRVHVDGPASLPVNTWVTAVLKAVPGTGSEANDYVPTVVVVSVTKVAQPDDPYEH